jgi:methylated-DNA-protein-cysteine methyltransferase-like protein
MMTTDGRAPDFHDRVVAVIAALETGEVVTYGEVAAQAGFPGAARAVGTLLRNTEGLPWWRVIAASGRLLRGSEIEQAERLRAEDVRVVNGRVRSG